MKMKISIFLKCALLLSALAVPAMAQVENLKVNREKTLNFKTDEERVFSINLKKGEYAEIFWKIDEASAPDFTIEPTFTLLSPSGKDLSKLITMSFDSDSIPFVAAENGEYKLRVKFENLDEPKRSGEFKLSLNYKDRFVMPDKAAVRSRRKINGYDVKIIGTTIDHGTGYLLIEKNGKVQYVRRGDDTGVIGFYFADDLDHAYEPEEKKSAVLMKTTADKTGDGTPDVAIEYYSGGAHCCFDLMFFELGKIFKPIDVLATGDARTIAIGKNPKGGLRLKTFDNTFGYWLTSFAGSPMPDLILDFKNGAFRPAPEAMKKPAPAMAVLQRKANEAKKKINLKPYTGEDLENHFAYAFWGEMLDLMYTGHEDLAWKYLDMVWDSRKQGKELFIRDFKNQLAKSEFWQMMREDGKR